MWESIQLIKQSLILIHGFVSDGKYLCSWKFLNSKWCSKWWCCFFLMSTCHHRGSQRNTTREVNSSLFGRHRSWQPEGFVQPATDLHTKDLQLTTVCIAVNNPSRAQRPRCCSDLRGERTILHFHLKPLWAPLRYKNLQSSTSLGW